MGGLRQPREHAPVVERAQAGFSRGFTLLEVLVTIVILAVGLLGLALLQSTSLNNQLEAYQRAQAMLLLEDMSNRIRVNSVAARAGAYADGADLGLAPAEEADCQAMTNAAARDLCQWGIALAGTTVKLGDTNVGGIVGARGCIENLAGSSDGELIVRLTIAWQGMSATAAPESGCGEGVFGDDDRFRRVATIDTVLADLAL
jgi:type IV pilus assembly protein PilV